MTDSRSCPICRRRLAPGEDGQRFKPFCSKRCADADLGNWLKGGYAIPAVENDDEPESDAPGEAGEPDEGFPRH